MTDPNLAAIVVAAIGSLGGGGGVMMWLLHRWETRHASVSQQQLETALGPLRDGVKVLLRCNLERAETDMVMAGGVCSIAKKQQAEAVYDAYHRLGGNGVGTQMIDDIRNARIARTDQG